MSDSEHIPAVDDEPQRLEQLVAWLDAELDEDQAHEVEEQLRKDAELRQEAEDLEHAWGMLDTLEPVSADHQFTMQTIQAVFDQSGVHAAARRSGLASEVFSVAAVMRVVIWFSLGFAGVLAGLPLARLTAPDPQANPDVQILDNLELLSRYPEYSAVRNVSLLQQLQASRGDEASGDQGDSPAPDNPTEPENSGMEDLQ